MTLDELRQLDPSEWEDLIERKKAALDYINTHKMFYFKPYDYQKKFYEAGAHYKQRYLRAANRVGKTYGAAYEMALHLTGLYPDTWKGERVSGNNHVFACIGVTLDSVAKVMQKELFGESDARLKSKLGTGAIPKDCIEIEEGWSSDGQVIRSCKIKHVSGGYNTLMFYGSTSLDALMGLTLKGVWIDEEPPFNSLELYAQAVTRTATTNGFIILTATPEQGLTPLNVMFEDNKDNMLYLQSVSWADCPHITESIAKQLLAGIPTYQHDMRTKGIPVIGSGAVFPYMDEDITINDVIIESHWPVVAGIDFGKLVDPSVITFSAYNPTTEQYYIFDEIYLDEDRSPRAIADAIKSSAYPGITCVLPHDAFGEAPETAANLLRNYGINVFIQPFRNPTDTKQGLNIFKGSGGHVAEIEPGLTMMRYLFDENKLKVWRGCNQWLKEKRAYFYKPGNGKQERTGADHCIDSSRYALMSLLGNVYSTAEQAKNINSNKFASFAGHNF